MIVNQAHSSSCWSHLLYCSQLTKHQISPNLKNSWHYQFTTIEAHFVSLILFCFYSTYCSNFWRLSIIFSYNWQWYTEITPIFIHLFLYFRELSIKEIPLRLLMWNHIQSVRARFIITQKSCLIEIFIFRRK